MSNRLKLLSLTGVIFLVACCGPVGPNWDTPWDIFYRQCDTGCVHYDSQRVKADHYNRMQEKKVVPGLGGVMYQPMY